MSTIRIAHLSDPHFGTVLEPVRHGLLESLRALKLDLCLISGDITQRATAAQFKAARTFKDELQPVPVFAIPGNHDIPLFNVFGRLFNPYDGFHTYFQDKAENTTTLGHVNVVGLNSTSRWRHIQGSLNVERVREPLLSGRHHASVRIVAIHHPLDCAKRVDDKNLLVDRETVFGLFEDAAIDLVISGHVHDPFVTLSHARYPASRRSMILSVAGTCLSWRTRKGAPNSFNLIEVEAGDQPRIKISRQDMGPDGLFHVRDDCVASFVRPQGSGWVSLA